MNARARLFPTAKMAVEEGYAEFNGVPHLAVDIPDGDGFTITAKTSEGKRITFSFMPYKKGGAPQCVDVQYHDNGTCHVRNGVEIPTFDAILFGRTAASAVPTQYDTRKLDHRPSIVCVLIDNK